MTIDKKLVVGAVGIGAVAVLALVLVTTTQRPTFTVESQTPSGTYLMEEYIPLATFTIHAKDADLDGSTFRVESKFSRTEDFSDIRPVGLMYDCPAVIPAGTVATCTAKVRFVTPGRFYYRLQDLSIERVGATDYDPISTKVKVGEGVLTIALQLGI